MNGHSNVVAGVIGTLAVQGEADKRSSLYAFESDHDIVAGRVREGGVPVLWDTRSSCWDSITVHLDPQAGRLKCTNNKIHSRSRSIRLPPGGGPWYGFVRLIGTVTLEFQPVRAKDDSAGQ